MKIHILKLALAAACLLSQHAFALGGGAASATARVLRVDDIAAMQDGSSDFPPGSTGTLVSPEGHVITSDRLVKDGDAAFGVSYLVLFPVYADGTVQAVRACLAVSQARGGDSRLLVLKINAGGLPDSVAVSDAEPEMCREFEIVGYPETVAKGMTEEARTMATAELKRLCREACAHGAAETSNGRGNRLAEYVAPKSECSRVAGHSRSRDADMLIEFQARIDNDNVGAPLIDEADGRLLGIATGDVSTQAPYSIAQGARAVQALAQAHGIKLEPSAEGGLLPYLAGAAVVLLIVAVPPVLSKRRGKARN